MVSRIEDAVKMFESGYNCCQSVFVTYADLFGMDRETALKVSFPLGAGMGRMREVCGTVSAMAMLSGLQGEKLDYTDRLVKEQGYQLVRKMSDEFAEINGSIVCREILGLRAKREKSALPDERTKEYYDKRPCSRMVRCAATIIERNLFTTEEK